MRVYPVVLITCATALALLSPAARAYTCYMLYDRNDNLVYRDTISPVDMSDQGASARESMRERGDYLVVADADRCPPVKFVFGAAGSTALSVDSIVGGMPVGAGSSGFTVSRSASRPIPRIAPPAAARGSADK
ncbi:MAG TPA: hypothetical protein VH704_04325 [Casimicrobiaceae bacterium]|jgi:hypothetical protein|nr:hypothetical protein [Casimicrobiaceae bacterium]